MPLTVLSVAYPFAAVGPDAVGGAEQVLSALDEALLAGGHRSIVIAREGSSTAGRLVTVPGQPGRVDDAARRCAWATHRAAIDAVLSTEPVDLVHLHGVDFANYLPACVPTLATLHLPLDWYPPSIFASLANLWLNCVSQAQHARRPPDARLLPPIANGVPRRLFETRQTKRGHAMMLSRICPEKGVHLGLQASRMARAPLLIGGEIFAYEGHRRYFDQEVAPLLDRRRRFLGPLGFERKRRLLAAARSVLVPSLAAETSSLTTMEALACGTPVIAFPSGALPDLVEDGRTGFIVSNVEEMAEAIAAAAIIDPAACRKAAAERFLPERMERAYLRLYEEIADSRQGDRRRETGPWRNRTELLAARSS